MNERRWPAEHLVLAAQAGDPASIAALVSGSHPHVQRFARTLCASPEDAEDAAQEALIILYRKVGSLRATSALYLGLTALDIGMALLWMSFWAVVLVPAGVLMLIWGAIVPEERYLRERFGVEYEHYTHRVRRWL